MNKISIQYDENRFSKIQNDLILAAFDYAQKAHEGQKRKSGDDYIVHPMAVAQTVAAWGLDHEAIMAALLHDVVEDTDITNTEITKLFGATVAELVDGLTKLAAIESLPSPDASSARLEISNENLRKLLLASGRDFRVILIKLADRLHNLRTLEYLKPDQRVRIARESLEIFAPVADRLGMGELKSELEDLSFRYWKPEEYLRIKAMVAATAGKSDRYLARFKRAIKDNLTVNNITPISIEGRHKNLYSIYKKLAKTGGDIDKIYDLFALRIILNDVSDCYKALGAIHQEYKPLIYRIKDYIAVPKPNGYQSLHTTVFGLDGYISEIQIRTLKMHDEAEHGVAAHFYYDASKSSDNYVQRSGAKSLPDHMKWVNELTALSASSTGQEFADTARLELFHDRIFVFSPRGDLYDLAEGATPVDFAFAIHSDIGLKTMGAKVNGRLVTLDTKLENRDVVEILTKREPGPNRDWLNFVQTPHARNRIKAWFRLASRDANVATGRTLLEAELKTWGLKRLEDVPVRQLNDTLEDLNLHAAEDMLAAIGEGNISVNQALRRLIPDAGKPTAVPVVRRVEPTGHVIVGDGTISGFVMAPCCSPVFPQPIVGYITRGKGVTVHTLKCLNLPTDAERYVACTWETLDEVAERLVCRIQINAFNRIGLLSDITGILSRRRINIGSIRSEDQPEGLESEVSVVVEVADLFVLAGLIRELERLSGVLAVNRV